MQWRVSQREQGGEREGEGEGEGERVKQLTVFLDQA